MVKETAIIVLLILVIYLYYQQNQPSISDNSQEIKHINKSNIEKQIQTELTGEQIVDLSSEAKHYRELSEKTTQELIEEIKIVKKLTSDLETAEKDLTNAEINSEQNQQTIIELTEQLSQKELKITKDAETQTAEDKPKIITEKETQTDKEVEPKTEIADTESSEESEENYYMAEEEIEKLPTQQWLDENYPKEGTCIRKNEYVEDGEVIVDNFGKKRNEITRFNVDEQNLEGSINLDGFVNLEELNFEENQLTSLDLSACLKLEKLICSENQLTSLDLSDFKELKELDCSDNQLTSLNVSNNPKLTELFSDARLYLAKKIIGLKNTSIVCLDIQGGVELRKNQDPVFIWKTMVEKFNDAFPEMKLMDISDLNELASQVNEITAQDKDFLAKICPLETEEFFGRKAGKIYWIFDQLSNTILVRGLIIQNRLYEGEDEEYEEHLENLAKENLKCRAMNPKNPSVSLYENRERLVNKALAGDKELLKRLAYLPYISQWVKDRLVPQEVLIRYQKEIHPDFTQELVLMWEEYDFSYEQTKEWIDIGLTPNDACFCYWLLDIKKIMSKIKNIMVKKIEPIHPGEMLREEFLIPAKLTPQKLANGINMPVEEIKDILAEKKEFTVDIACRLALFFGMSLDFWLGIQKAYELDCWQQRWEERAKEEVHPLIHKSSNTRVRKHV